MVDTTFIILIAVRLAVLGLGVLITYYSLKAYRRTRTHYLRNASRFSFSRVASTFESNSERTRPTASAVSGAK